MRSVRFPAVLAAALAAAGGLVRAADQHTRGFKVVYKAPPQGLQGLSGDTVLYEHSYAVVVGVDKYQNGLPELSGAARDARSVAKALQGQGFAVTLLLDEKATKERITELLADDMPNRMGRQDRVLVYFAGHGVTKGEGDTAMGYLMPHGADRDKVVTTGISMREMQNWFQLYKSKHVLFVADACYSGLALSTRAAGLSRATMDYLRQITSMPVRMSLVAGTKGEEANELDGHGLFTGYFLQGIGGAADTSGDGIITGDELAAYVKPNVAQTALAQLSRRQNPQIGRSGEGEFVFLSPRAAASDTAPAGTGVSPAAPAAPAAVPDASDYKALQDKAEASARRGKALEEAWDIVSKMAEDTSLPRSDRLGALVKFLKDFPADNVHASQARLYHRRILAEGDPPPVISPSAGGRPNHGAPPIGGEEANGAERSAMSDAERAAILVPLAKIDRDYYAAVSKDDAEFAAWSRFWATLKQERAKFERKRAAQERAFTDSLASLDPKDHEQSRMDFERLRDNATEALALREASAIAAFVRERKAVIKARRQH